MCKIYWFSIGRCEKFIDTNFKFFFFQFTKVGRYLLPTYTFTFYTISIGITNYYELFIDLLWCGLVARQFDNNIYFTTYLFWPVFFFNLTICGFQDCLIETLKSLSVFSSSHDSCGPYNENRVPILLTIDIYRYKISY